MSFCYVQSNLFINYDTLITFIVFCDNFDVKRKEFK